MGPGFPGGSQFVMLEANLCYPNNIKSHFSSYNSSHSIHTLSYSHVVLWELLPMKSARSSLLVSEKRRVCAQGTALEVRTVGIALNFIKKS